MLLWKEQKASEHLLTSLKKWLLKEKKSLLEKQKQEQLVFQTVKLIDIHSKESGFHSRGVQGSSPVYTQRAKGCHGHSVTETLKAARRGKKERIKMSRKGVGRREREEVALR